jgi:integrase
MTLSLEPFRMKLTAAAVARLKIAPGERQQDIKDDGTRGLYLRLFASGKRSFIYRYKLAGKVRVLTLGDADTLPLTKARHLAAGHAATLVQGHDPGAAVQQAKAQARRMPTVAEFAAEYIERHAKPNKRTWAEDQRALAHDVLPAIGRLKLDAVHRRDIVALVDAVRDRGALIQSNRVLAVVRRMFGFAVERSVIEASPVTYVRQVRETPRERVLTDAEITALWHAAPGRMNPGTLRALRLLLLTGARSGEVVGIARSELDLDARRWLLPAERSKNRLAHVVPLTDPALKIVTAALADSWSDQYLFPAARGTGHMTGFGLRQAMERLFGPGYPTVHDIRRTVGTRLSGLGVNRLTIDKVLNHKDTSVGGIYDRHSYDREKRQALDAWAREVDRLVNGEAAPGNVLPLPAQRAR